MGEAVSNVVRVKLCSVQVLFVLNILVIESNQGLHLPNLVEKVCQKGSRLRHLHLEELNQPPDNTSLHEEDPFVCIFLKSHIQVFRLGPGRSAVKPLFSRAGRARPPHRRPDGRPA